MKKTILLIILAVAAFSWQSCTKSCTCESPSGKHKEIEVDPSEKCKDRSDSNWTCS